MANYQAVAAYMGGGKVRGQAKEGAQAGGQALKHVFCQLLLCSTLSPLQKGPCVVVLHNGAVLYTSVICNIDAGTSE